MRGRVNLKRADPVWDWTTGVSYAITKTSMGTIRLEQPIGRFPLGRCPLVADGHAANWEGEVEAYYRTNPVRESTRCSL